MMNDKMRKGSSLENADGSRRVSDEKKLHLQGSFWVVLGFMLWIGFFIGAVILHAMDK
ncbi:MAG: hypothetical protein HY277_01485 [Ignavibacteriales bacterium]|nr:hypothetical protein [Ignavibacteriales bacterium]